MDYVSVKQLFRETERLGGKEVKVSGWIRTIRDAKNFGFIELNDGTFFKSVQVVFENEKIDN